MIVFSFTGDYEYWKRAAGENGDFNGFYRKPKYVYGSFKVHPGRDTWINIGISLIFFAAICEYMHICIYADVCMYVCIHIRVRVCACVYCVCVDTHTQHCCVRQGGKRLAQALLSREKTRKKISFLHGSCIFSQILLNGKQNGRRCHSGAMSTVAALW
jgi:hypothetical protein